MHEKEINKLLLEQMPDIMYHGCSNKHFTIENFKEKIRIFNTLDEYIEYEHMMDISQSIPRLKSKGRTNLDAAFHGIYFTPNYENAYKVSELLENSSIYTYIKNDYLGDSNLIKKLNILDEKMTNLKKQHEIKSLNREMLDLYKTYLD